MNTDKMFLGEQERHPVRIRADQEREARIIISVVHLFSFLLINKIADRTFLFITAVLLSVI